jgi:hypothetical protein
MKLPLGYEVRMTQPSGWRRVRVYIWTVLFVVLVSVVARHTFG